MESTLTLLEEMRKALSQASDTRAVLKACCELAARQPGVECVWLYQKQQPSLSYALGPTVNEPIDLNVLDNEVRCGQQRLRLPLFLNDVEHSDLDLSVTEVFSRAGARALALIPIFEKGQIRAVFEFRFSDKTHRWSPEEDLLLEQVSEICGLHLQRLAQSAPSGTRRTPSGAYLSEVLTHYEQVARFGNLIIVRTDSNLEVVDMIGETQDIIGLTSDEISRERASWSRFVHPADLRRLLLKLNRIEASEINEEIRVINQRNGNMHWILLRATPRFSAANELIGWDGYGVDITERHKAQEELVSQGRRIEALYAVSRSLQSSADPALVTLKGLNALVNATHSDSGIGLLYDETGRKLETVASVGLSQNCVTEFGRTGGELALIERVVDERKGGLIDDLQQETEGRAEVSRREGLRSAIIMPLVFEERVLGLIMLFRRRALRYSAADFDLVAAATSQISLAARDAELFMNDKQQSSSLAALYRLSHQLSKQVSLREVIQNAFPVIQEELACKRIWLGVVSERGTHLVGQAGIGPGIRQNVIDLQLEIENAHPMLRRALTEHESVVVDATKKIDSPELERLFRQLSVGTIVIVPLVALGQTVGALVIEPSVPSTFFAKRKLPLLNSMAAEIAPVILARRFEQRMAEAQKMRAASLLASGVAHNFNNLLQAVMGQASLIEMQSPPQSKAAQSARMINEAATRGANLVKQLFSVSASGPFAPQAVGIEQMLNDSKELYRSILGSAISLDYEIEANTGEILGDYSSIQQVLTNLLINSKEAIGNKSEGRVVLRARKMRVRSGEVDPELAPGMYLRVDVEDNGAGMSPEHLARCFEPFFTTKNVDSRTGLGLGGAGLGLSSAYSIMKKHDGLIAARSELGQGATFSLYFPAVTVRAAGAGGNGDSRTEDHTQTLIKDDDLAHEEVL